MSGAIPTANTNLGSFGFGAMFPLLAPVPVLLLPSGETCELLHTLVVVQKMMGSKSKFVTAVTTTEGEAWQAAS
jgi:hypothetical protein